jgi:ATP-dependent Lon protease
MSTISISLQSLHVQCSYSLPAQGSSKATLGRPNPSLHPVIEPSRFRDERHSQMAIIELPCIETGSQELSPSISDFAPELDDLSINFRDPVDVLLESDEFSQPTDEPASAPYSQPQTIDIVSPESLSRFRAIVAMYSKRDEHKERLQNVLNVLDATSCQRNLALAPRLEAIDWLEEEFPNLRAATNLIRKRCALAALGEHVMELPPILLVGPPGVGKTAFAIAFANLIASEFHVIDLGSVQTGSVLSGSEDYWSNTQPGRVFKALVYGSNANPVFVLEELEKVSERTGYNVHAALLLLLERATAQRFCDQSVRDLPIDASKIMWIATANSVDNVDAALLSRFYVVEVPFPTRDQTRAIVHRIYKNVKTRNVWGKHFSKTLSADVVERLTDLEPRGITLAIEDAFGSAALAGRDFLVVGDLELRQTIVRHRHMGFHP